MLLVSAPVGTSGYLQLGNYNRDWDDPGFDPPFYTPGSGFDIRSAGDAARDAGARPPRQAGAQRRPGAVGAGGGGQAARRSHQGRRLPRGLLRPRRLGGAGRRGGADAGGQPRARLARRAGDPGLLGQPPRRGRHPVLRRERRLAGPHRARPALERRRADALVRVRLRLARHARRGAARRDLGRAGRGRAHLAQRDGRHGPAGRGAASSTSACSTRPRDPGNDWTTGPSGASIRFRVPGDVEIEHVAVELEFTGRGTGGGGWPTRWAST